MIISQKFNNDKTYSIEDFAQVCEIEKENLIYIENMYCKLLDYNFFISNNEFQEYSIYICKLLRNTQEKK